MSIRCSRPVITNLASPIRAYSSRQSYYTQFKTAAPVLAQCSNFRIGSPPPPSLQIQRRAYAYRGPTEERGRLGSSVSLAKARLRAVQAVRRDAGQVDVIPEEPIWDVNANERAKLKGLVSSTNAPDGLHRLLENDAIVVVRQIEMMNIFLGFEQANRYALLDPLGNPVGYMAEEERGFLSTLQRQILRTHRPFRCTIMDAEGNPVLWVYRPFAFINSRTFVQQKKVDDLSGRENAEVLGEVQQHWHPWRRRYSLFTGALGDFAQFAGVDAPFLSWSFFLQDERDVNTASVVRNFTGFGREIFTDTGQYVVTFRPDPSAPSITNATADNGQSGVYQRLSLEERATVLALSATLDIDFFSRHSEGSGMGIPFFWWGGGD